MIEKEYKYLLTRAQYTCMLAHYSRHYKLKIRKHTNYYFDNENFDLYKSGYTLRIRAYEDEKIYLQLKTPIASKGNLRINKEKEIQLGSLPIKGLDKINLWEEIQEFKNLEIKGTLVTFRYAVNIKKGITIILDKNSYLNETDYELEMEFDSTTEDAATYMNQVIEKFRVEKKVSTGKKNRLFSHLLISKYHKNSNLK